MNRLAESHPINQLASIIKSNLRCAERVFKKATFFMQSAWRGWEGCGKCFCQECEYFGVTFELETSSWVDAGSGSRLNVFIVSLQLGMSF